MDLCALNKLAFELMGNRSSHDFKEKGNKYYHGQRVAALALKLRKLVLPDDDGHDEILTAAAWFHDVKNGTDDHAARGAEKAKELLSPYCTDEELAEICEIIRLHGSRHSGRGLFPPYVKLHQDADHLDHFGTFDVWACFLFAASHGETINDVRDWLYHGRPRENERYRDELNYDISRIIFDEKTEFLRYFTDRFYIESSGGIWNEEQFSQCEGRTA